MDTVELKNKMEKLAIIKSLEKKYKDEKDALQTEIEKEIENYFTSHPNAKDYSDENIHFGQEVKLSRKIDSKKVLVEHSDLIIRGITDKKISVSLEMNKTTKLLKDYGIEPENYISLDTKTQLTYDIIKDVPDEPF